MIPRKIALYVTEAMADWEYAHLTAQIAQAEQTRAGRFSLVLAGDGMDSIRSMGGLQIQPVVDVADLARDDSLAALVIPGGSQYDAGHERLLGLVETLLGRHVPVAAICGATLLLARGGLLDERRHTSNDPSYLAMTGYQGAQKYTDDAVVTDRGITTASGLHSIAFTAEVMRLTGLWPESIIDAWERLNTTGDPEHFGSLMEATREWQNA